ncbi:MAG: sigma-70 family RNA polymerase sigma factor [Planctomycetales bacterium]|nr:sigma-70 family RNA polymerase sigma factor [Planctomycetales bacterium]
MNRETAPDWPQIVESHSRRVFAVAMRILGSAHDAEDVSQEVFLEAYRLHATTDVRSWTGLLVRLATLRSLDWVRRGRPTAELLEQDCAFPLDPAGELIQRELADALRAAVGRLPERQATVFVMTHFEEMTREEIAESLNVSLEAVSTSLYKARQQLSKELNVQRREG